MNHIALTSLITALIAAMSSCATDKEELPLAYGAAMASPERAPEKADNAIVCGFGNVHDNDSDQKKGCTTLKERQDEKQ